MCRNVLMLNEPSGETVHMYMTLQCYFVSIPNDMVCGHRVKNAVYRAGPGSTVPNGASSGVLSWWHCDQWPTDRTMAVKVMGRTEIHGWVSSTTKRHLGMRWRWITDIHAGSRLVEQGGE